jgi:hypothetical protein
MKPGADELIVHVVLKEWARKDEAARDRAVQAILEVSCLRDLNEKRLRRYGIVSGIIPRERFAILKALSALEAVSEDAAQQAL